MTDNDTTPTPAPAPATSAPPETPEQRFDRVFGVLALQAKQQVLELVAQGVDMDCMAYHFRLRIFRDKTARDEAIAWETVQEQANLSLAI